MGRKKITTYKLQKLKKLINEGKTTKETAEILKISTATVANYRAYFKKKGDIILMSKKVNPSKKFLIKKQDKQNLSIKIPTSENKVFTYMVNGTKLEFDYQPKEIKFSENKIIIEL